MKVRPSGNLPQGTVDLAIPAIAHATAQTPVPPLGTLGITPASMVVLPFVIVPQPAGVASVSFAVPNNPVLAGVAVHAQALLIQAPVQALLTNVTADVIPGP